VLVAAPKALGHMARATRQTLLPMQGNAFHSPVTAQRNGAGGRRCRCGPGELGCGLTCTTAEHGGTAITRTLTCAERYPTRGIEVISCAVGYAAEMRPA
jgi:hypothetical protein